MFLPLLPAFPCCSLRAGFSPLLSTKTSRCFPASLMIPTASSTDFGQMLLMERTRSFSLVDNCIEF